MFFPAHSPVCPPLWYSRCAMVELEKQSDGLIMVLKDVLERCPLLDYPSPSTVALLLGFLVAVAVLGSVLPGRTIAGALLEDKTRIYYKANGFNVLVFLLAALGIAVRAGVLRSTIAAEKGGQLFAAANILCLLATWILYITGSRSTSKSASLRPRVTGNLLHDWWFGVQLNPQVLGLDLKFFWIRAGMIAWLLINLSIAAKQKLEDGALSPSMILFQTFSALYVIDFLWYEAYMTSTWDIIAENFGFMLVFGDMVWIPFGFSIQGWWLLSHKVELSKFEAIFNVVVFVAGYIIFRGANKQKHVFKHNPSALIWGQPPKVIGGKLLVSGYWGIARHCNYLGDLLVAVSLSLMCGTSSVIPYFYPVYLFILLIWRERRDEERCRAKYKDVWVEYCKAVPWRIFPGIY